MRDDTSRSGSSMALHTEITAHGSVIHRDERCVMEIRHLGRGVTVHTVRGTPTVELARIVIDDAEVMQREAGRCVYLVDALDEPDIDPRFREAMTEWFRTQRGGVAGHMLIRSHLVEMALNVAHLFASRLVMQAYTDVETWEAVGRRESGIASFRRTPIRVAPPVPAHARDHRPPP